MASMSIQFEKIETIRPRDMRPRRAHRRAYPVDPSDVKLGV